LQIVLLRNYLSPEEFQEWGWRVPFWISIILLLIAFKARIAIEETPVFVELSKSTQNNEHPLLSNFRDPQTRKHMFLLFFCISAGGAVLFFCVQVYTAIFLKTSLKVPSQVVDQLSILGTVALFPLTIFAGWLSDKVGRKPVVLSGLFLGAILIQPAFNLMQFIVDGFALDDLSIGITWPLILTIVAISLPLALVVGPQTALLAELFPAKSRNSAATLPHNLAAGWIGGLLPLIVTWINQRWDSDLAGLWYPTIFLTAAFFLALWHLPETKDIQLTQ
jgi:MFS family permease